RRIRAEMPAERQPHIVAMTANAMAEDREASREAGMDDFLSKPVRIADLTRVLRRTRRALGPRLSSDPPASEKVSFEGLALDEIETLRKLSAEVPGAFNEILDEYLQTSDRLMGELEM